MQVFIKLSLLRSRLEMSGKDGAEVLEFIVVLGVVAVLIAAIWPDLFSALKNAISSVPDTFSGNDTIYIN